MFIGWDRIHSQSKRVALPTGGLVESIEGVLRPSPGVAEVWLRPSPRVHDPRLFYATPFGFEGGVQTLLLTAKKTKKDCPKVRSSFDELMSLR